MCNMGSQVSRRLPLEIEYKGCCTRAKQMIQEEQGLVECYV